MCFDTPWRWTYFTTVPDQTVIALWLGHESTETTSIYLHADMQLKERALANTTAKNVPIPRYRPSDRVMDFPEGALIIPSIGRCLLSHSPSIVRHRLTPHSE